MKKPRKKTTLKEDTGKFLLDLGKLVIGSIILGGILRSEIPQNIQLTSGIVAATVLCIAGLILGTREKKTGRMAICRRKRSRK